MTSTNHRAISRALLAPGRRRARRARLLALPPALALLAALAMLAAPPAEAGACTVPGTHSNLQAAVDDAVCSLVNVGSVTITETVAITRSVAVQGVGAANSIIDGNAAGRVIDVSAGIDVSLSSLTVQNGHLTTGSGAGVRNAGRLTLSNVRLGQNVIHVAAHFQYGAGLYNAPSGVVTLTNVIAAHNEMSATVDSALLSGGTGLGNHGVMTATNVQVYSNTMRVRSGSGGGIYNNGTLALNSSAVTSNTVAHVGSALSDGGGIYNNGTAVIQGGQIAANFVGGLGSRGGGVQNQGHLELSGVLIANNTVSATITAEGGGVNNWGQYLAANNVTLRGNTVSAINGDGAGLMNSPTRPVLAGTPAAPQGGDEPPGSVGFTWVGGLIESNSASRRGGGVFNAGPLSLEGTRIMSNTAGGDGGGIYNQLPGSIAPLGAQGFIELPDSVLHLDGVTLRANTAGGDGGGLYNHGYAEVLNTTAEANSAGGSGGGIYTGRRPEGHEPVLAGLEPNLVLTGTNLTLSGNHAGVAAGGLIAANQGAAVLLHATVVSNTVDGALPAGLVVSTTSTISLHSSIAAFNQNANCSAGVSSAGYNIDSGNSCALASTGDEPNTDPLIGPLANNGGPVRTHALLESSPALDTADESACPTTDARGEPRPSGPGCDMGAYELQVEDEVEYRLYLPLVMVADDE